MATTDVALPAIGVRTAIAPAVRDLLDHPVALIAANSVWGVVALLAWLAASVSPVLGIAAAMVLVWPTATVSAVAARVVRDEEVTLGHAFRWPLGRPAVALLGLVAVIGAVIGGTDIVISLARGDLMGVAFATLAAWGLVALWALACVVWPLLGDPERAGRATADLARIAATVALAHTPRVLAAAALVALGLMVSTVLIAAVLTVSVSIAALLLCRVVLPLADAVERGPM